MKQVGGGESGEVGGLEYGGLESHTVWLFFFSAPNLQIEPSRISHQQNLLLFCILST